MQKPFEGGVAIVAGGSGGIGSAICEALALAGLGHELIAKPGIEEWVDGLRKMLPRKKFGTAEDVAEAVIFLLSEKGKYITGQSLAVDGGLQL